MLKTGERIPEFETVDESGIPFKTNALRGKRFVLYFYPKDDTPGCTAEACSFRDNYQVFLQSGISVYGISGGNAKSHKEFKEKHGLPFPLLIDDDYSIAKLFDVYRPMKILGKSLFGVKRITFLIDEEGRVEGIFGGSEGHEKVKSAQHAGQIAAFWRLKL